MYFLGDLADMLSFMEKRRSSAKLAEWSPSDWPESLLEMRTIDNLLRCSICYEFFDVALIIPECSHNYCSLCIRRSLSYDPKCPTCSLKVTPLSLKNNRVLDELVKSFIKVRTKLLELTTSTVQVTSVQSVDKKGGEPKNKKIINTSQTNTKRRKAQSSSQNSATFSSPNTKRQKLDTENEQGFIPVKVAENDEEENSSRESTPEVVVIEMEKQVQEPLPSEPQPVVISEHRPDEGQPSQPQDPELAECPVCGDMIQHRKINSHLDACLNRTEKKSSLRTSRKESSKPSTSKSSKCKSPVDEEFQDSSTSSSNELGSSTTEQEVSSIPTSSNVTIKGSNALIRLIQKRKPLPKLVYNVMSDKELLRRLKEWNLSTKGNRSTLIKRHQEFVMLYNSQCDSERPMTAAQIVREVEKNELTKEREAASVAEASTSHSIHFTKNQSEGEMDEIRQEYLNQHKNEFDKLIADVQKRKKGKSNLSAKRTPVSERLDVSETNPTDEDLNKKDQGNIDTNEQEINDNSSESSDQTYPPFFKKSTAPPDSSKGVNSRTCSVIPEPPSSPSLVSFEEDEGTPSLGLEDNDWELKDGESDEPLVIPESPVIKVGSRATDGRTYEDTVSSDSEEEFQQTFVKNKKVKSNLF
ncbi:E3 ubiquitin-protein ligase RAD18-like isoform X2 [Stylophora pistillata]|uniref:E3 ubiquitin-protein ligase RAD18-like isoform X2 n=1 Tax=Stylophora pistillata TaxID=50429 RepID=UPI000C047BE8|nr:E3 ubiquitin-protein ligase RAD18-like isoform X2 [Stylophora pistillata]